MFASAIFLNRLLFNLFARLKLKNVSVACHYLE